MWTMKQLKLLSDRRKAGESTEDIAASVGTSANNLRHRWRKHIGFSAKAIHARSKSVSMRTMRVWGWLRAGFSLTQCCVRLEWPADQRHLNRLSMALRRYCTRNGIALPCPPEMRHVRKQAPKQAHPHARREQEVQGLREEPGHGEREDRPLR
jgi:hypothetical protein